MLFLVVLAAVTSISLTSNHQLLILCVVLIEWGFFVIVLNDVVISYMGGIKYFKTIK